MIAGLIYNDDPPLTVLERIFTTLLFGEKHPMFTLKASYITVFFLFFIPLRTKSRGEGGDIGMFVFNDKVLYGIFQSVFLFVPFISDWNLRIPTIVSKSSLL